MILKTYGLLVVLLFCTLLSHAQKTSTYFDEDILYKKGLELFDKQQYVASQKSFSDFLSSDKAKGVLKIDAEYYAAACAIELFHKDGEWRMRNFIEKHPESLKLKWAYFYLGKSSFRKKKYDETIDYMAKVDIYSLDKQALSELYFKRGYSYFEKANYEKAKLDLYEIKDIDNKYAHPANYYYSHIAYKEKKYETALQGFNRLLGNETFGPVVPYYITQIYFIQGKYNDVTREAPILLLDSIHVQKTSEINRMIGESYFHLQDYQNALTFLKNTDASLNAEGNYALGYCYYKLKDYTNAITYFEKAVDNKDSLAQNAWYHMADCHINNNNKSKARNAYYSAYTLDFNPGITENALYSYAKLCYELSFNPYNEAINAFNEYIKKYPNSTRKEEAYTFLVNVYSTTKSYKEAIASIEKIHPLAPALKTVYQKLVYFKAVEHYNNSEADSAAKYFKKSLQINADKDFSALSTYWLGDISYAKKDYSTAIDTWQKFQLMPSTIQLKEYDIANYNIGYAYFHRQSKDDYTNANIAFRKYLLLKNNDDTKKIADAMVRTADCYFMNRDFAQAAEYYDRAVDLNKIDVDYCYYQKALCNGVLKNNTQKINDLKTIETKYPSSNYMSASLYEIAETYNKDLNDGDNAIIYYNRVLKNFPNASYINNCLAGIGLVHYNRKEDDKAFDYFNQLVKKDPKGEATKEVLPMIKKIFEAQGKIEDMEQYFAAIGNPLNTSEIETSLYDAAKDAYYNQKNCDIAMPKFESYITKYPNGKNSNEAHFCYAECAYSKELFDKALPSYKYIINQPRNIYSEVALVKTSYLLYKDKKYDEVLPLYKQLQEYAETPANKLTARLGAMRCAFYLNKFDIALEECNKVLNTDKLSPQQISESKYIKAKSLFELQRYDDAFIEFKSISKSAKNITGAEAIYHMAKIYFIKQDYKEVEKTVNSLISYNYTNDDWNTKGMLLIADSYMAKGDDNDAEVILQTILDSSPKPEYIEEIKQRQDKIKAKKSLQLIQQEQQQNDMKIQFEPSNTNDTKLFDDTNKQQTVPSTQPTNQPN